MNKGIGLKQDIEDIKLPKDLVKRIDSIIKSGKSTPRSRVEFVKKAVEMKLLELGHPICDNKNM